MFFGCVAVLLLVLALNGGLTLGALRNVHQDTLSASARVVGNDWALRIQGAIRFGKPIEQFYGLDQTLQEIKTDLTAASMVAVTDARGEVLNFVGDTPRDMDLKRAVQESRDKPPGQTVTLGDDHYQVFPILHRNGEWAGTLALIIPNATVTRAVEQHVQDNILLLLLVAAAGSAGLLAGLLILNPTRRDRPVSRLRLYAMPILVLILAQGVYSYESIQTFRSQYLGATHETARLSVHRLERDLERLFEKGVKIERLVGIEAPFLRVMQQTAEIGFMEIARPDGQALYRVHRDERLEKDAAPYPMSQEYDFAAPLEDAEGNVLGLLRAHLSEEAIAAGVRQRLLDSGTVALVSALFVGELFLLLTVLLQRQVASAAPTAANDRRHVLARPGAFLLLFAWALPLSFIPLRMRELHMPSLGLPEHVILALPLSAEMLCALVMALVAGAMSDKRGWHLPFLLGVGISILGAAMSALAHDGLSFILARALVGTGYGLAWMGIQGFIFAWATPQTRARGLSHLVAGIFAGHICGGAVGAMLAQQIGYGFVFWTSAVLTALPALFALTFMRPYLGKPAEGGLSEAEMRQRRFDFKSMARLLRDRNFLWLMLGSVVPFSVAQVGLLYYTLPLFLADQGVNQASIGRIMMIYGLSVIYLGPLLARYVDLSTGKRMFIVLGGLIGSTGMIYLFFDHSLLAITLSVFMLGLASALSGSAQSAFALELPVVKEMGSGKAMGVQRAADKLGQMLGPLVIGAMFATIGTSSGLAATGLYYMLATLAFLLLTRSALTGVKMPRQAS
ncbi:MFS transporter [Telmatospirillum sp. J64-1]|uniref:MFS transporter n=1 Tax=Telmatospirillum sp. J64-1 TaxID=2502183 RepID=UPI00115D75D3|nr:MFS transporter [Telmatospirillum sp. J64-1]